MRLLHLLTRIRVLIHQVQARNRKDNSNGPAIKRGVLRRVGVNDELMHELTIAKRDAVRGHFVVNPFAVSNAAGRAIHVRYYLARP